MRKVPEVREDSILAHPDMRDLSCVILRSNNLCPPTELLPVGVYLEIYRYL